MSSRGASGFSLEHWDRSEIDFQEQVIARLLRPTENR
jgi:hypothetical protein